jgi:hypothetical protein
VGADRDTRPTPHRARVPEVADQFLLLGIDAQDGPPLGAELVDHLPDVPELAVPVGVGRAGQSLDVDAQIVLLVAEQMSHRGRAGRVTESAQFVAEGSEAGADERVAGHRIAARCGLNQGHQRRDDPGIFFLTRGRPPPGLRMRSVGRS